jgi:hypothetical protein
VQTQTPIDIAPPPADWPPPKARRRRWPWILAGSLLIPILSFVAWAGFFLANYQPIGFGSGSYGIRGTGVRTVGDFTSPKGDSFRQYRMDYRKSGWFKQGFTLWNHGPVDITIESIELPVAEEGPLLPGTVRLGPTSGSYVYLADAPYGQAFQSFRLPADEYRFVEVRFPLADCNYNTSSYTSGFDHFNVRYKVLGVTRHTTIYPPLEIEIRNVGSCRWHATAGI